MTGVSLPVGLGLIYPATALFAMVMLYAAYAESGTSGIPIVRIGLVAALVLIVLLGVLALFPVAGWFAVLVAELENDPSWRRDGD